MNKQQQLIRSITTVPCAHCSKTAQYTEPTTQAAVCGEECAKKALKQRRQALDALGSTGQDTTYSTQKRERPETFRNVSIT